MRVLALIVVVAAAAVVVRAGARRLGLGHGRREGARDSGARRCEVVGLRRPRVAVDVARRRRRHHGYLCEIKFQAPHAIDAMLSIEGGTLL